MDCNLPGRVASIHGDDSEVVLPGGLSTWTVTYLDGLPPSMAMTVRLYSLVVSLSRMLSTRTMWISPLHKVKYENILRSIVLRNCAARLN
jgi:hypothetical protein